jgi:hypothetical protein
LQKALSSYSRSERRKQPAAVPARAAEEAALHQEAEEVAEGVGAAWEEAAMLVVLLLLLLLQALVPVLVSIQVHRDRMHRGHERHGPWQLTTDALLMRCRCDAVLLVLHVD